MPYLVVYLAGVVIALMVMRDPWPARLAPALVWPLGPIAFVLVLTVMVLASAILWPVPILGAAALVGVIVWLL